MVPLPHIHTVVDNTAAQGWANRCRVSSFFAVGPILRELSLLIRQWHLCASMGRVRGEDNKVSNVASRLTHLSDRLLLRYFNLTFPQQNHWRLIPLPSACRRQLTSMLHNKRSLKVSPPQSTIRTTLPGASGASSAFGCTYPPISKASQIPSPFSRSSPSASVPLSWQPQGDPSRRGLWNSTFGRSAKYSQPWRPTNPDTTSWAISTFGWASNSPHTPGKTPHRHASAPPPSPSSKPWTPPTKAAPTASKQSSTWPGSLSSSSSV